MVSAELLNYISNIFANLHNNTLAFSGINIILVRDLAQLPPVTGLSVFHASVWKLFYPLFLKTPQCQNSDEEFYHMLEEIHMGNLSYETWNKLHQRNSQFLIEVLLNTLLNTTHIVGFKENAELINRTICNSLPVQEDKFLISQAIDFINIE